MNLVSIVVLNWNGRDFLRRFLPELIRNTSLPGVEIIVADNGSDDGSVNLMEEEFPGIRLIRFDKNYGFSEGYNKALAQVEAKYFLLLNTDIEVTPKWLEPLVDFMEKNSHAAACTPKIKDWRNREFFEYAGAAGGYIDRYGYPFCRGRIFDHLEVDRGQHDTNAEVFWGTGACLMVRSALYREAGGLDDWFFAHMEEIDLCWRLKRMGYSIWCVPASTIFHVGGGTLERGHPTKTFLNFRNSLLLLCKNLPPRKRRRVIFIRKMLDGISAARFLLQGSPKDCFAVLRAHRAYSGMKKVYRGTGGKRNEQSNSDIVSLKYPLSGIYQGSIVIDFFIRGRKTIDQFPFYDWRKKTDNDEPHERMGRNT